MQFKNSNISSSSFSENSVQEIICKDIYNILDYDSLKIQGKIYDF